MKSTVLPITAQSPAKIIFSGEHAIVLGAPALAMAVNRFVTTTVTLHNARYLLFNLVDLNFTARATLNTLKRLCGHIQERYVGFTSRKHSIREVLQRPFELLLYTVGTFIEEFTGQAPRGIKIETSSSIPLGCGMGSSAAMIMSVVGALARYFHLKLPTNNCLVFGMEAEKLQHGLTSGLDLYLALHGGCVYRKEQRNFRHTMPQIPLRLINTGAAVSSTGECVDCALPYLRRLGVVDQFAKVTQALSQALKDNDVATIHECVRTNHRLLCQLGVVPQKAQRFIDAIEARHMSAKISGAGSVRGDSCGVILVIGDDPIDDLIQTYNYTLLPISGETRGTRIISR